MKLTFLDYLVEIFMIIPIYFSVLFSLSAFSDFNVLTINFIALILCVIDLSIHVRFTRQDKIIEQLQDKIKQLENK